MKNKTIKFKEVIIYTLLILGTIVCMTPLVWMVRSSLMEMTQIFEFPPKWIPDPVKFDNYHEALTILPFAKYFFNTIVIVIGSVSGTVFTSAICAYSFSRLKWRGRDLIFNVILSSMMLPFAVTLIPTFIGWRSIGIFDSPLPLILPSWFGGGAFNIFLLRQFFLTIPKELDESAYIDGANFFTVFSRILMPLIKPSLIAVGIFSFLGNWNDLLGPVVYLNSDEKYTLALGLRAFIGMYQAQWHYLMAAATVVLIPVLVVFFIGQKYFVEGIVMSGLKG